MAAPNVFDSSAMEPIGRETLALYIKQASTYLEYGCGFSTVCAARSNVKNIISVDSDPQWIMDVKKVVAGLGSNLVISHCDIGEVGEWGYPKNFSMFRNYYKYATLGWDHARKSNWSPQVVLIDGRFRVACFLYSLLVARAGTPILFDDYRDRSQYHLIEKYCDLQEMKGRMAVFLSSKQYNVAELTEELLRHSIIPD